ncbi:MAG: type II toxin-antitoxin system VapC family toxin [Actinomycetota bacterium]
MIPRRALAYIDASIVVRTLMHDEDGHPRGVAALADTTARATTWTLTQVEATCALRAAHRAKRIGAHSAVDSDMGALFAGPDALMLLPGSDPSIVDVAMGVASRRRVRALDAMHIAVALVEGRQLAADWPVVFITADHEQGKAAKAEGLRVVAL